VELSFPQWEVDIAKIVVRHLVATGKRQCISDLMMLSGPAMEEWFAQDAIRYLQEQKALRQDGQLPKPKSDKLILLDYDGLGRPTQG